MINIKEFNLHFIVDKNGKKKWIILPIKEFESLMEDLEDLAVINERRDEETV